jgi:hypothetical protein
MSDCNGSCKDAATSSFSLDLSVLKDLDNKKDGFCFLLFSICTRSKSFFESLKSTNFLDVEKMQKFSHLQTEHERYPDVLLIK